MSEGVLTEGNGVVQGSTESCPTGSGEMAAVADRALQDRGFYAKLMGFAGRARFRGSLVENCKGAPMGKGHGNNGRPFDIETACYLKPLVEGYHRPGTRKVVIKAGVKTLKSFFLELCAAHHACHAIGDVCIFFGSGESAEDVSTTRILNFFEGIASYREKMATITGQWDVTMGAVKFPDKTLFIKPANLSNTQQKNLGFVGVQDAFVCGANGMIDQAIDRTTQYPHDKKIVLESQGGEKGFDFDRHYEDTNQGELHVRCPVCQQAHVFNWKAFDETEMRRGEDFRAVLPIGKVKEIVSGFGFRVESGPDLRFTIYDLRGALVRNACSVDDLAPLTSDLAPALAAARDALTALLLKEERRVAGFKRGDRLESFGFGVSGSGAKADNGGGHRPAATAQHGEINEQEVLRNTCFECFHCGSLWRDDGEFGATRIGLDKSSHYVAARPEALPENLGFNFPQWINRRLPWGPMMLRKLQAQKTASEFGNFEQIKLWWQKVAGRTWDANITVKAAERPGATIYDEKEKIPGELCRISSTDIQFRLTHMVYLCCAVGDGVPPRVLHYEWVKPPAGLPDHQARDWCKNRVRELDKQFGIEQQNSMKDAAHEPDQVREWAAEDAVFARIRDGARITNKWVSYGLLMGDDKVSYRWEHPGRKSTWERFKQYAWTNVEVVKAGKRMRLPIHHRLWSNPSIKDIAERWRDGISAPKLQIHEKWLLDKSPEGLWAQLTSERKLPWKGRPGKLRYDNEGKPNHAWDCFCMIIERMDELGYLNTFGVAAGETEGD